MAFPDQIDNFETRTEILAADVPYVQRFQELKLKTNRTPEEETEMASLLTRLRNKFISSEDWNKFQNALVNMQVFIRDNVVGYIDTMKTQVDTAKDQALIAIEQKKNGVIDYLDGTEAGKMRNDIGVMADLTTTDKASLVKAINQVNAKPVLLSTGGDMTGAIARRYSSTAKNYRNLASQYFPTGNATGAIKIIVPRATFTNTALRITINGHNHVVDGDYRLTINGYANSGTSAWAYPVAVLEGNAPFNSITLGFDGSNLCILLGGVTTVWNYAVVEISEVSAYMSDIDRLETGWNISLITDISGITKAVQPTIQKLASKAEVDVKFNAGVSIANNTDLNNVINEGEYYCATNVTAATITNSPVQTAFSMRVQKWSTSSYGVIQTLTTYSIGANRVFVRSKENTTWGAWIEQANQTALNEVKQSVVDGKGTIETAIIGKGSTVSKAGSVATFPELVTGINNIQQGVYTKRTFTGSTLPTENIAPGQTGVIATLATIPANVRLISFIVDNVGNNNFTDMFIMSMNPSVSVVLRLVDRNGRKWTLIPSAGPSFNYVYVHSLVIDIGAGTATSLYVTPANIGTVFRTVNIKPSSFASDGNMTLEVEITVNNMTSGLTLAGGRLSGVTMYTM